MSGNDPIATVFTRRVRPGAEEQYETWLAGIARASGSFPGSQGTTLLRPGEGSQEYSAIVHFDSLDHLDRWLASPERTHWIKQLQSVDFDCEEVTSLAGIERWFTLPGRAASPPPPRYKTATLVFLGLYPTVLLLDLTIGPLLVGLPTPLSILVSLLISVPLMVWTVVPLLSRLFSRWLRTDLDRRDPDPSSPMTDCVPRESKPTR
jgi:antibiotic biosynthesis monooxygenase (ABM) superfamily enzyme